MPVTERDRTRLAALQAIVKPANSLAARIDTLTDEQRRWYIGWKAHCERWMSKRKRTGDDDDDREGRAYQLTLDNFGPVDLRDDIRTALYGPKPTIPIAASDLDAVNIYNFYRGQ
jgi:hypothetical protein